jgi:dolichol-phosphate mannosyltransferase
MRTIAIIPAYNEEGKIGLTVKSTINSVDFVLVVNDGSSDNTDGEVKEAKGFVINHKKNRGAGAAIRTGIDYAIKNKYDVCVVLGGDNQDNGEEVPKLLEKIKQGYDFVQGSRRLRGGKTVNMPLFRRITTKSFSTFFSLLTGFEITDGSNGFRAFKVAIFKNNRINLWQKWLDRYELEPYLYYMCIKEKFKVIEIPVTKKYPETKERAMYTKMSPLSDYWKITRPLVFLKLGIKK